jgi:hypothetical protein
MRLYEPRHRLTPKPVIHRAESDGMVCFYQFLERDGTRETPMRIIGYQTAPAFIVLPSPRRQRAPGKWTYPAVLSMMLCRTWEM